MALAASAGAGSGDEGLPLWGGSGYAGEYWGGYGGVGWYEGANARRSGSLGLGRSGSLGRGEGRIEAGGVSPGSHAVTKWRRLPPSNWRSVPYAAPAPAQGSKSGSSGSSRRRD